MKTIQWLIILVVIVLLGFIYFQKKKIDKLDAQVSGFKPDTTQGQGSVHFDTIPKPYPVPVSMPSDTVRKDSLIYITKYITRYIHDTIPGSIFFKDRQPIFELACSTFFPSGRYNLTYAYFKKPIWSRFSFGLEGCLGSHSYISGDLTYKLDYGIGISYFGNRNWGIKIRRTF
jgi:hypothetical protein